MPLQVIADDPTRLLGLIPFLVFVGWMLYISRGWYLAFLAVPIGMYVAIQTAAGAIIVLTLFVSLIAYGVVKGKDFPDRTPVGEQ